MGFFSGRGGSKKKGKKKRRSKKKGEKKKIEIQETKKDDLMNDRDKLVRVAATFLANPKIEKETLELKNAFLRRKGLTDEEIKKAFELYKEKIRLAQEEKELKEEIASYNSNAKTPENMQKKIERAKKSKFLSLKDFQLAELPEEIFEIEDLKVLIISGNPLTSLPGGIGKLKDLKTLHAANCSLEIEGIPEEIYGLEKLQELNLANNNLLASGRLLTDLKSVKRLNLSNNELLSLLEEEDQQITESLVSLNLSKNNLSELPRSLSELPNLKTLKLSGNNFDDELVQDVNKSGPKALMKHL